jgi:DMSO/TMAO reductase YedYZ molybdopterin-dependent catalytic subunit
MNWKKVFSGALIGLLLVLPITGVMYFARQAFGAPFAPFDTFNWVSGKLPGPVITFGIDLMIETLRFLGIGVASAAKTGEQLMAIGLFTGYGVVAGALYFFVVSFQKIKNSILTGLTAAVIFGTPILTISMSMGDTSFSPLVHFIWVASILLIWGWALSSAYQQFTRLQIELERDADPEQPAEVKLISRRKFLIYLGGTSAAITVIGAGVGRILRQDQAGDLESAVSGNQDFANQDEDLPVEFPNENDPVEPAPGTRPEYTPLEDHYKVFIELEPTDIEEQSWHLPITGMVDNPLMLTLDNIRNNYEPRNQFVTLRCISGRIGTSLISTTLWTGASLKEILADADIQDRAQFLIVTSGDGYYETINLDLVNKDPRIMLTYNWDGQPIPKDHGFPLRVWIPDVYGMKQPKWITGIEVTDEYQDGYWVERGWDKVARVNTTSVIDTVATNSIIEQDGQQFIPIGGIAYSGARGISKVEVRVDDGEWREAQLRQPLSDTSWVLWRFDWPFQEGKHTFSVRCFEGDGTQQIMEKTGIRPDGVTGIHSTEKNI